MTGHTSDKRERGADWVSADFGERKHITSAVSGNCIPALPPSMLRSCLLPCVLAGGAPPGLRLVDRNRDSNLAQWANVRSSHGCR